MEGAAGDPGGNPTRGRATFRALPNEGARDALREIAARSRARKKPAFLYVNNRLEGFAPGTIETVAYQIET